MNKRNNKKNYNSNKNKSNNRKSYNTKKGKIKLNKTKDRNQRKELLAKGRRNVADKMPNDLSFCFVGKLSKKNTGFGFIEPISDDLIKSLSKKYNTSFNNFNEDIYVTRELSMGANNDDIVLVRIFDQKKHYEGKIIKILKRNTNNITGIYEASDNFGFVKTRNKSFSTDIYIRKENSMNAKTGDAVLIQITKYPEGDKKTEGKVLKIITNKDDSLLDLKILLAENNIDVDFPDKVKKELLNIPDEVLENELKNRIDYTSLRTYTIDGEDAKDFDDAISIKKTQDTYHLYVHIADVSQYVKEGSEIDQEARLRGFSIYLLNTVIPMLDFKISNKICSLIENNIRLTLSIYFKIDKNGNIIDKKISESYINVDRRLTYTLVQDVLDNKLEDKDKKDFKLMKELALILKKKRDKDGYIDFNIPEPHFITNKDGKIISIEPEIRRFSDEIIEQFMLISNETIGKYMKEKSLPLIFRVHEQPDIDKVLELKDVIEGLGLNVKFLNNKKYSDSKREYYKRLEEKNRRTIDGIRGEQKKQQVYDKFKSKIDITPKEYADFLIQLKDHPLGDIVSNILLRSMRIAKYSEIDLGHFGIATDNYSHFTAPIRRYTDLFVHRILKKHLQNNLTIVERNQYFKEAKTIAEGASMIESKIVGIEREYYDIKTAEFMENKIGQEFDGRISSITNFGIYVSIFGSVEGLIRYVNMEDYIEFDSIKRQAKERSSNKLYKLGDKIKVRLTSVDVKEGNIDFAII